MSGELPSLSAKFGSTSSTSASSSNIGMKPLAVAWLRPVYNINTRMSPFYLASPHFEFFYGNRYRFVIGYVVVNVVVPISPLSRFFMSSAAEQFFAAASRLSFGLADFFRRGWLLAQKIFGDAGDGGGLWAFGCLNVTEARHPSWKVGFRLNYWRTGAQSL